MTTRDHAIMEIVKALGAEPQTNESLALLNKLASLIMQSMPHYDGMGEGLEDKVRRWNQW
jgi:hypothetical protein